MRSALRLGAAAALAATLSSCILTGVVVTGYYGASGGNDHDAHVAAAWRGPAGELALALEELEGVCRRTESVLVLTADELEQMFAAKPSAAPLLPIPHVRLPRAVLARELAVARPAAGSEGWVPAAEWEAGPHEVDGARRYVLPEPLAGAPLAVHWTHRYRTGAQDETGFALLVTRSSASGVEHALLLPEPFEAPAWTGALVPLALAADVLWIVLLLA